MIDNVLEKYYLYCEKKLDKLTIKNYQIIDIINQYDKSKINIELIGKSFEDRDIFEIKIGTGEIKILLWSQMHGNEPVGTMVIFDIINFLIADDEFNAIRQEFLSKCSFYFIPMLNPDGAERFVRRNAQGIDLNRDALKLTAPESKILDKITTELKPDFAFNLHDQKTYYAPFKSDKSTIVSLLAPAFDYEKTIDTFREKSMLLIADVFNFLQNFIPEQVAKYNDSFIPNAFGDNTQKKGISTILFEAGYIYNDLHRQNVRKYYFMTIIFAVFSIVQKTYLNFKLSDYQNIPMNQKLKFCDILLKNATIKMNEKEYKTDIALIKNITDSEVSTDLIDEFIIWDIGDLDNLNAFKKIDMSGIVIEVENNNFQRLKKADFLFKYINNNSVII